LSYAAITSLTIEEWVLKKKNPLKNETKFLCRLTIDFVANESYVCLICKEAILMN
jgi:hypothetical protein